jgi:putative transport protein
MGLEYGFGAGLLAGALTSTPTLAGAQDAVKSGLATMPGAVSQAQVLENIGVGYALTYVFGTLGMILVARFFPRIAGIDLPAEAAKLASERGLGGGGRRGPGGSLPIVRAYRLPADMVGKTVAQVDAETGHLPGKVLRVKRGSEFLDGAPDLVLEAGDLVSIIAGIGVHEGARRKDAEEVLDPDLLNYQVAAREIIVTDVQVVGKTLQDLDIPNAYGCFVTALTRASIDLPLDPALPLQKGDRLEVVGEKAYLPPGQPLIRRVSQ